MRIAATIIAGFLLALPGLATGFTAPVTLAPEGNKLERVARDGLTSEEWLLAMMAKHTPQDFSQATLTKLEVPQGHTIVGRVVNGQFTLDVLPNEAVSADSTPMQASGLEPAEDCENDVVDYTYASAYPLTANILYPVTPNVASAGLCGGASGLPGPVNYLTFRTTGDAGGWLYLTDGWSAYEIGCTPWYSGVPTAMAGAGAGVGSQFKSTLDVGNAFCYVVQYGDQPSAWDWHVGWVVNWNYYYGDAYASVATSGVYVGNVP